MAAVKIHTGDTIYAYDNVRDVPKEEWDTLLNARCAFAKVNLPYDCRELLHFVEEAQVMYEHLGYSSVEDLIRRGLELDPILVDWAVQGLRTLKPNEPLAFDAAVVLGRRGAPKGNRNAAKNGEKNKGDDITFVSRGSTGAAYLRARLQRDAPAVLKRLDAGEFTSVRAAAVAAGIVKPPDVFKQLCKWWRLADDGENGDRQKFLNWLRQDSD